MRVAKIYIGTSGWHYKHWKGTYYPPDIKDKDQFAAYATAFSTVELNNSFYRLPSIEAFDTWRRESPEGFLFAVKVPRFVTHMKKLNIADRDVKQFTTPMLRLGKKLGPLLFQLPPKWNVNVARLEHLLRLLPPGLRYCFEFRNASWYTEEVYEVLRANGCAFCIYELAHHSSPVIVTADFVYVRLHGPGEKYQGSYTKEQLKVWAVQIRKWRKAGKDVYVYFDNDQAGYAAFNARDLRKMFRG